MPETDILNPLMTYDPEVGGVMGPDYGFTRKRTNTRLVNKAPSGPPYSRETQNTGHVFNLTWGPRAQPVVDRLKQYEAQYKRGYFTLIDWESANGNIGAERHYVGRFVTEVVPTPVQHGTWMVQNLQFEEMPGAPMLKYPDNWDRDATMEYVNDDFGDLTVNSTLADGSAPWTVTARPGMNADAGAASASVSLDTAGAAGDFAQYQYRGYGFQLWMLCGPDGGQFNILLDGELLANPALEGLSNTFDSYSANPLAPAMVLSWPDVPLDIHRVKIIALGASNVASTGTNVRWWALQGME